MDMVFFFGVFGAGLTAAACCFAALTMLLFSPEFAGKLLYRRIS
jgi:hypothetical protein